MAHWSMIGLRLIATMRSRCVTDRCSLSFCAAFSPHSLACPQSPTHVQPLVAPRPKPAYATSVLIAQHQPLVLPKECSAPRTQIACQAWCAPQASRWAEGVSHTHLSHTYFLSFLRNSRGRPGQHWVGMCMHYRLRRA
jgi:hypothetical protein